jgi:hypothetical protein
MEVGRLIREIISRRAQSFKGQMPSVSQHDEPDGTSHKEVVYEDKNDCT